LKRSENPRFYGQNKLLFWHPTLQPLGYFSHVVSDRSSSKNIRKTYLHLVLNKKSPWAHMELDLDVLGVAKKFMKYVVHSCKKIKNKKRNYFSLHKVCKQQAIHFGSQGILGVNP
jgi:hypothetical protein